MDLQKKRLKNELNRFATKKDLGCSIKPYLESDLTRLKGLFTGFSESAYENGTYEVEINVTKEYPHKAPKARFITKVWHPNISSVTGCICLNLLNGDWQLVDNLATLMGSIKALLICAEPNDPQDAPVASQYSNRRDMFDLTASFWNYRYAGGERKDCFNKFEEKVKSVCQKGYTEDQAIHALSMNDWSCVEAFNSLN